METKSTSSAAAPASSPGSVPYLRPEDIPCLDNIRIDDGAPVDNIYSEKQQRLLVEPLVSSWPGPGEDRKFLVVSNVGLFYAVRKPPLVPDVMLSLDVELGEDRSLKENLSYFVWILGKPPEVVIEIVSNTEGEEDTRKFRLYAQLGILYYVIWDPERHLRSDPLRVFTLSEKRYVPLKNGFFPVVGLGVTLWQGMYENWNQTWLRWCDASGIVIPTGAERADRERLRADQERLRAERMAEQLRALGGDPDNGR
jgi:Uma2 family endonuclease